MNIAVLVYGRLNKCAEHYDNIVNSIGISHNIDFFLSSDNSSESLLNDFIRLYKPKMYNNDSIHHNYNLGKYPGTRQETNIPNMICHFINKNRVYLLFEEYINKNNIQYDCIISLRIDCVFQNNFVFDNLTENTIYIPSGNDWVENAINDQIAYGKIDVMKKYNCMDFIYLLENQLSIPHPESLNLANIKFNKLLIERIPINYFIDK